MRDRIILLTMLAALPMGSVMAVETNQVPALTLDACLAEAARRQPDIAAAKEAVQRAEFQYKAALSAFLPQLSANASASRSRAGVSSSAVVGDDYTANLQAQESLYTGGHDTALLNQRRAERDLAREQLQQALAQLSADVHTAFASLLYAVDAIAQTTAIVKLRADDAGLVELRYEGGREHKGNLLLMQALLNQARFDEESARRTLGLARQRLARALGREQAVPAVSGMLTVVAPEPEPDYEKLTGSVPSVRMALAQVRAASAGVRVAKSEYFPTISAAAGYGRNDDVFLPQNNNWSVGVQLNYAFFPGGRNIMDVRSAQSDERRFGWLLRSQWQQTLVDLQQAYNAWWDAAQQSHVQQQFLQAAELRAEIARSQYTSGLMSFDDWAIIENDLIAQQKADLTARRDAVLAQAAWEKACGVSLLPLN